MEKARISKYQFFILIIFFEIGSAMLVALAMEARQDAWLAILMGMAGGLCLYYIYYELHAYYPDLALTEYAQNILGNFIGRLIGFLYVIYFIYGGSRILRDVGEVLVTFSYWETPIIILNLLLILVVIYAVRKGIEVLAKTGELLFILIFIISAIGFIIMVFSGLIEVNHLRPVLEHGIQPVLKTAYTQTLYFPFGEMIVFTMILPYMKNQEKTKRVGFIAIGTSGLILAFMMAINIAVLGVSLAGRSQFPLLSTIQTIDIVGFLSRLDVFFMLSSIINVFFKISLYTYAAVIGTATLFSVKESYKLVYPIGAIMLILSMVIGRSFTEHVIEGLHIVPIFVHLPFQIIIPFILLILAFLKNRKKNGRNKKDTV
ncbi:GerAB/ArcD/ProY family transporter [Bacillus massiliglaciei]|uniref:GerAB/ArcD/ProY family transporter n=1 Tax=Bacillus massiliglaciei TaxID=1816693 RepID=UPI000B266FB4|nr:GerAB/ArcD/ProY family transporter [Bacillus massiliglaciei]